MDVSKIIDQIQSIKDQSCIYLLEALSESAGFFTNEGKLLYIAKDYLYLQPESIATDYLKLQTHIWINSVKNDQTFADGYYNIIIYTGSLTEDPNTESFVQVCSIHARNTEEISFKDFFYSLISLFQLPTEQSFKNVIGLYGELKLMEYSEKKAGVDISKTWHKNGPCSQYDFSNDTQSIEVKTTTAEDQEVTIKHQQLFNSHTCYLAIVICHQDENGESLSALISSMFANQKAFNNVHFSLSLAKELKRVSKRAVEEIRFSFDGLYFYSSKEINPFPSLPDNVKNLSYLLNTSDFSPLEDAEVNRIFELFK